jgi:hypothetical protein
MAVRDLAGAGDDARQAFSLFESVPGCSGEMWFETACCRTALAGFTITPTSHRSNKENPGLINRPRGRAPPLAPQVD